MIACLLRMALILSIWVSVVPFVQSRVHTLVARQLGDVLRVETSRSALDDWRYAATLRKSPPVIRLPKGVRSRLVQAWPVDPSAVPSMHVSVTD